MGGTWLRAWSFYVSAEFETQIYDAWLFKD